MSKLSTFKNFTPFPDAPTGSLLVTSPFSSKENYIEANKTYLQSDYPNLFSVVGKLNSYAFTPVSGAQQFNIAWTGTSYVSVGYNIVARSTDGITWTNYTPNVPQMSSSTGGNGYAYLGSPFTSGILIGRSTDDGITWKASLISGGIRKAISFNSKYILLRDDSTWSHTGYQGVYVCDNATGANGVDPGLGHGYYDGIVVGSQLTIVGTGGKIRTTTDNTTWVTRTSGTTQNIYGLVYGNGLYVYGASGGVLATSTDAITWTARTSNTTSSILGIAYGNSTYVYVGATGALATSTDGVTWTSRASGTTNELRSVIFNNGIFVKYGAGGLIRTSTDGITWTAQTSNTTSYINTLVYQNGLYVYGTSGGGIGTSTDAITWTARASNGGNGDICSLIWDGTKHVANGWMLSTSVDGATWTNVVRGPNGTTVLECLAFSSTLNMVVGIGYNGWLVRSTDNGMTWTRCTNPSSNRFDFIEWYPAIGMFLATNDSSGIIRSTDGITWTACTVTGYSGAIGLIVWGTGQGIATTNTTNSLLRSTDGITWTKITTVAKDLAGNIVTFPAGGVLLNNTQVACLIVDSTSFAYTSPNNDFVNWTQRPLSGSAGTTYPGAFSPTLNRLVWRAFRTDNGTIPEYSTQYNVQTEFVVPSLPVGTGDQSQRVYIKT